MDIILRNWYFYFVIGATILCGEISEAETERHSKQGRYLLDTQHFVSDQQRVACATTCVDQYFNLTRQCCLTGNNKDCFSVPLDILKPYVGHCPSSAHTNSTPITTTTATTRITTKTATTATTTTPMTTTPTTTPATVLCHVCAGPAFLCEKLHTSAPCAPPNNYCINKIVNHKDGTRDVERSCGSFDTCYREWFQGSSDNDKCRQFDGSQDSYFDFQCTYCCVKDNCNDPLVPSPASLYNPN